MGCMNDKTYDGPCKLCGYRDDSPCIPAYLPPKSFLNERYIVGKLLSYNGEGATYIGFDSAAGIKVTIKEFMPDTLCGVRGPWEIPYEIPRNVAHTNSAGRFLRKQHLLHRLRIYQRYIA